MSLLFIFLKHVILSLTKMSSALSTWILDNEQIMIWVRSIKASTIYILIDRQVCAADGKYWFYKSTLTWKDCLSYLSGGQRSIEQSETWYLYRVPLICVISKTVQIFRKKWSVWKTYWSVVFWVWSNKNWITSSLVLRMHGISTFLYDKLWVWNVYKLLLDWIYVFQIYLIDFVTVTTRIIMNKLDPDQSAHRAQIVDILMRRIIGSWTSVNSTNWHSKNRDPSCWQLIQFQYHTLPKKVVRIKINLPHQ